MKKLFKTLVLIFIFSLVLFGCTKKKTETQEEPVPVIEPVEDTTTDTPETPVEENLADKITIEDNGYVAGEKGNKYALLKVMNRNSVPVTVSITIKYNTGGSETVNVIAGSNKYVYAIAKNTKDTIAYDYTFDVVKDSFEDYNSAYSGIKVECSNTGTNLILTLENRSSKTITSSLLVFFYKDSNIVSIKELSINNALPSDVKKETIDFPVGSGEEKIIFDKVSVLLNEIKSM